MIKICIQKENCQLKIALLTK